MDDYKFKLGLAITREEELKKDHGKLFEASKEMLRIAGIANQGSNAYNRAIINLHETVESCAKSRARSAE